MKPSSFYKDVQKLLSESGKINNFTLRYGFLPEKILKQREQHYQRLNSFLANPINTTNDASLAALIKILHREAYVSFSSNTLLIELMRLVNRYDHDSNYGYHEHSIDSAQQPMAYLNLIVDEAHSSSAVLQQIYKIDNSQPVEYLKVNGFNTPEQGLALAKALNTLLSAQSKHLRCLYLENNALGDHGLALLAPSIQKLALEECSFADNQLTESSIKTLNSFFQSPSLRYLDLAGNNLNAKALEMLLSLLGKDEQGLQSLSLSRNPLSDEGILALSVWLGSSPLALQQLAIAQVDMTNKGAKALAAALQNNIRLSKIELSSNRFDAEGLKTLLSAVNIRLEKGVDKNGQKLKKRVKAFAKECFLNWAEQALSNNDNLLAETYLNELLLLDPTDKLTKIQLERIYNQQQLQQLQQQQVLYASKELILQHKLVAINYLQFVNDPTYLQVLEELVETEQTFVEAVSTMQDWTQRLHHPSLKQLMKQQTQLLSHIQQNQFTQLLPITPDTITSCLKMLTLIFNSTAFAWQYAVLVAYAECYTTIIARAEEQLTALPFYNAQAYDKYILSEQLLGAKGLLINPVQRIPRYELLINELLKSLKTSKLLEVKDITEIYYSLETYIKRYTHLAQVTLKKLAAQNKHQNPDQLFLYLCQDLQLAPVKPKPFIQSLNFAITTQKASNKPAVDFQSRQTARYSMSQQLNAFSIYNKPSTKDQSIGANQEYRDCILTLQAQLEDPIVRDYYKDYEDDLKAWDVQVADELEFLKHNTFLNQEKLSALSELKRFSELLASIQQGQHDLCYRMS